MKKIMWSLLGGCWMAAAGAEVFYWIPIGNRTGDWPSFGDAGNWAVGIHKAAGNADSLVPGENDYLVYYPTADALDGSSLYGATAYFNLSGTESHPSNAWSVKGFHQDFKDVAGSAMNFWNPVWMIFRKGSITFTESYTNNWSKIRVQENATFTLAATASSRLGAGGAENVMEVYNTGTVNLGGALYLKTPQITVSAGGTLKIDPTVLKWDPNAANPEYVSGEKAKFITNDGTFNLPNGFQLGAPPSYGGSFTKAPPVLTITQNAGTMTVGGDITLADNAGTLKVVFAGGTVNIGESVTFAGNVLPSMPDNATVTLNVAAGKTLNLVNMAFGANTTLNVNGAGNLILGANAPTTLNLASVQTVTFAGDTTLAAVTGYDGVAFAATIESRETRVLTIADATLRETVYSKLTVPDDCDKSLSGNTIVVGVAASAVYWWNWQGSQLKAFADTNNWTTGTESSHVTAATAFPGDRDYIGYIPSTDHYTGGYYFDLDGRHRQVAGMQSGTDEGYPLYRNLYVRNGTLEFVKAFPTRQHHVYTYNGGKFIFGRNCTTTFTWGGAVNEVATQDAGTEIDVYGDLLVSSVRFSVAANTTMIVDPTSFKFSGDFYKYYYYPTASWSIAPYGGFANNGELRFVNGLAIDGIAERSSKMGAPFIFTQNSGVMYFGGSLTASQYAKDDYAFALNGGTLVISNAVVSMSFMNTVGMPTANSEATIDIGPGATLDWSKATFAEGTTLNVTGSGKLLLGADAPTTLNLSGEGEIAFSESIALETVTGYETTIFSIDSKVRNRIVISTSDAALKERIASFEPGANRAWDATGADLVSEIADSRIFIRDRSDSSWRSFSDSTYWLEGTRYGSTSSTTFYPGYRDWIGFVANAETPIADFMQCHDLDGKYYRIKGISIENVPYEMQGYGSRTRYYRNGTIEFTESYYVHRDKVRVEDTAKLIVAASCASDVQWGGAENVFNVFGELDWQGTISLCSLQITAHPGSTVNFAPSAISLNAGAGKMYSCFDNSGTMKFPSGLAFAANGSHSVMHPYNFYQRAGEMEVGGDFTRTSEVAPVNFTFDLIGGTLKVTDDSAFALFDRYGMPTNDTTATVEIAAGKVLDWSKATFASGTTLNVTGAGTIILGTEFPATLNLAEGVTLGFNGPNAALNAITGIAGADFYITDAACLADQPVVVASGDAAQVAAIGAKLTCENADWGFTVSGSVISVIEPLENRPHEYIWMAESSLESVHDYRMWSTEWDRTQESWQGQPWANPHHFVPRENDYWLYGLGGGYEFFYFNLDGEKFRIGGLFGDGGLGASNPWFEHKMIVTNGELEIVHSFTNYYILGTVRQGAKFTLAPTSFSRLGYSGARNNWTVEAGGEIDYLGSLTLHNARVFVNAGAKFVLDPVSAVIDHEVTHTSDYIGQGFFSSGDMEIPNGFALTSRNTSDSVLENPPVWSIDSSGSLLLGGDVSFVKSGDRGLAKLRFNVLGGTVTVTNDTSFVGLDALTFTNDDVSVAISADATLDLAPAIFGSEVGIVASGAGTLAVSKSMPAALTLGNGMTLKLTEVGVSLSGVVGYANANFIFDGELKSGDTIATCADAAMATAIAAKLQMPAGFLVEQDGLKLLAAVIVPDPEDVTCFQSEGEKSLADDQGSWNTEGGAVPQEGDVFVSGASTIAVLDADTVAYDSISVMRGATLKVTGAVASLPAITLYYGSRLLFAEDAAVTLTEPIDGHARAAEMPIVEIASGAVLAAPDGYGFKNQHLKNYGTIKFAGAAYIGTAEADESTLFQLTSVGGNFDFAVNGKEVRWVAPKAAGGRVHVVGKILLKDSRSYASKYNGFRCSVGRDNPADEVFDFELDNTTLMLEGGATEFLAGGARFKCYNGGRIEKSALSTSPGVYAHINFSDAVHAEFDGDATRFLYFYNRYPVSFRCPDADHEVMTFKNGACFHVMHFEGNDKCVLGFEDGFWDITEKPGYDSNYWKKGGLDVDECDTQNYLTAPFTGFRAVRIGSGKTLGLRSYSFNPYEKSGTEIVHDRRWNRRMQLADVPVTGADGSLYVTNAAPEQSLSVTLTCGRNTATGDLWAEPSEYGCELMLADGANWAGTLVASETIGFTNLTDAAAAATVTVNNVRFAGKFPIRVWKGATAAENAADRLTILGTLAKTRGGFAPVEMNGAAFAVGDTFTIGTIPAANLPANYARAFTSARWRLTAEGEGETKTLKLVYDPAGTILWCR